MWDIDWPKLLPWIVAGASWCAFLYHAWSQKQHTNILSAKEAWALALNVGKGQAELEGTSKLEEAIKTLQESMIENFRNFNAENVNHESTEIEGPSRQTQDSNALETMRISEYERNTGLFLIHHSRPSAVPGQVADVAIALHQHECKGAPAPLTEGRVASVEYELGNEFFDEPVVKTNAKDNFRLDVSAYGPMLCLARVRFSDGRQPIVLQRYINF